MRNTGVAGRGRSLYIWIGLLVVAVFYMVYALQNNHDTAFGDDPSIYLISAKALVSGRGYNLINFSPPRVDNIYPIGYPALLAALLSLFRTADPVVVACAASTGMCFAWIVGTFFFLKRYMQPRFAGLAAVALGLTQRVFLMSWGIASEWPFALLIMVSIVVAERYFGGGATGSAALNSAEQQAQPARTGGIAAGFAVGVLVAAALLMRSMGITFIAGFAAYFFFNRQWRGLVGYLVGVGCLEAPWMLWSRINHVGGGIAGYAAQYMHDATPLTPVHNFVNIISFDAPATFLPFIDSTVWQHLGRFGVGTLLQVLIGCAMGALAVVGCVVLLRAKSVMAYCGLFYLALVLVWPWEPERFCIPAMPIFIVLIAYGCRETLRILGKRNPEAAGRQRAFARNLVTGALLVSIASSMVQDSGWLRRLTKYGSVIGKEGGEEWQSKLEACQFLQRNSPENAIVISSIPFGTYLFSNRHTAEQPLDEPGLAKMIDTLHGTVPVYIFATYRTSYAEVNYGKEFGLTPVNDYMATHPDVLKPLWHDSAGKMAIYQVAENSR